MIGPVYLVFEAAAHAVKKVLGLRLTAEERRRLEKEERRATRRLGIAALTAFVIGGVLLVFVMRYLDGISK